MKNLPNILTIFRIICVPLIFFCFSLEDAVVRAQVLTTIFLLAGISDFFDGYLARKLKVESRFGALMDPIADKLLTASVLICLVFIRSADLLPVLVIVMREILVSGLREYLASSGGKMPVTKLAKWKTVSQFAAITILLAAPAFSESKDIHDMGIILLWLAALLTLITGVQYTTKTVKIVKTLPPPNVKLLPAPVKKTAPKKHQQKKTTQKKPVQPQPIEQLSLPLTTPPKKRKPRAKKQESLL